jgi:hypothetical protein
MEKQTVSLALDGKTAELMNTPLFDRWRAQLPVDVAASPDVASVEAAGDVTADGNIALTIHWKNNLPANVQCFPDVVDNYDVTGGASQRTGPESIINLTIRRLAGKSAGTATLNIVVGYDLEPDQRRGIRFKIALPKAAVLPDNP